MEGKEPRRVARAAFWDGVHDGVPIMLGYLVVGFTIGIAAKNAGLSPLQGFLTSLLNNASAGEYAAFRIIEADAPYWEMALMTLIANARYLLMSCVISQKFAPDAPLLPRVLIGFDLTDEFFGLLAARRGNVQIPYGYGVMSVQLPGWAIGTLLGVLAGAALPQTVVAALSVALYGMFIAIITPPARENRVILLSVVASFVLSTAATFLEPLASLSGGTRTILLTLAISGVTAYLAPISKADATGAEGAADATTARALPAAQGTEGGEVQP